ncbi:protein FAR1-RELATED SEQUENCE 8-like [Camellia sinensis]|uniref:protein FAR1-RELATED SEQUENCE 8-like n=1 Tax=Camellia sinensis TaxID=4442 RepID=UPI001035C74B|nr:protein FAR1-RELATED SEQUENCE 8-like [Camellia sinensis]
MALDNFIRRNCEDDATIAAVRNAAEYTYDDIPDRADLAALDEAVVPTDEDVDMAKRRLEINDEVGIGVSRNFHSIVVEARGHEALTFDERDAKNYIESMRRLRLGVGDTESVALYFHRMQQQNSNFYSAMDLDEDGRMRNLFWLNARNMATYKAFGDVVSFDTTYLTNKYDMPFVSFAGVNHHGQPIFLGCGLLSNENTETFEWLFKEWLSCMSDPPPKAIITDQCRTM